MTLDRWPRALAALLLVSFLAACATAGQPEPPPAPPSADAGLRLRQLLDDADEQLLERNPMMGLLRGDLRRAGQHGDGVTPRYVEGERQAAELALARLDTIPCTALPEVDRVACDTFRWTKEEWRERHSPEMAAFWAPMLINQTSGWHLLFAEVSSGDSAAPYRTVQDYEHGLSRIDGFITWLDRVADRMREGQRSGRVMPRVVVERVIAQFDDFARQPDAESPYLAPVRAMPADFSPAERDRLTQAYQAVVDARLRPALRRMHAFLANDYLPSARSTVGLSALEGGARYYDFLIRSHTTASLSADDIHALGLSEVERIGRGMQAVQREVGHPGTLNAFFEHLRNDPRYTPASAAAMAEGYQAIGRRVDAALPRLFDGRPRTPLAIRPTPPTQAPSAAAGSYTAGSLDTGQPGVFFFNTHDLPSRPVWGMETLYLHEATPGHHMQLALAAENTSLPKMLRFDSNTAFAEGWALYAESLGPELGLFTDPYQRFGHYNDEMLRAMRLVVDTGLHARGWTREQAIDYMLSHSAMARTDAVSEVERYIAWPGQALAYKVGALTIQRLRQQAKETLGDRFDVRAFHAQVLGTGGIPLAVLEKKVELWIAAQR